MSTAFLDLHTPPVAAPSPVPGAQPDPGALRAEAVRQLHWQQQTGERRLASHPPGQPCLVPLAERALLHESLDLLRHAGEPVPSCLYRRGSLMRTTDATGMVRVGVSLASLLADITRALAWLDAA